MITRSWTPRSWIVRLVAIAVLVASLSMGIAPANAAGNRLPNGHKLYAGQCIRDAAGTSREAKFCVGHYSKINLYYKGKICWSSRASRGKYRPNAFVRVAANGDVEFFAYAGGPRLWHSGTIYFSGADLVVGSHLYGKAILAVDTGTAFWTFKSCH